MKPNLLFVQSAHAEINAEIERFCDHFCSSHYVYILRPGSGFRDDTAAGVRFLSNPLDRLPSFAVDSVICISDPSAEAEPILRKSFPASNVVTWDPDDPYHLPDILVAILSASVIRGNFSSPAKRGLARAI